jgi:hypothetical protein
VHISGVGLDGTSGDGVSMAMSVVVQRAKSCNEERDSSPLCLEIATKNCLQRSLIRSVRRDVSVRPSKLVDTAQMYRLFFPLSIRSLFSVSLSSPSSAMALPVEEGGPTTVLSFNWKADEIFLRQDFNKSVHPTNRIRSCDDLWLA